MPASAQGTAPEIPCHTMPVGRRNDQQKRADDTIKILQRLLNKFDFRLKVDGFFGAKTEAAVKEFQRRGNDHDPEFLVDGIVGPQTWNALGACILISEG